jgi:glycosyltransferase involved in cell wall biosynthesis
MPALHVAQINFLQVPERCSAAEVLEQWPSLVDIADAVAGSGAQVSVIQAASHGERLIRNGVHYHFTGVGRTDTALSRGRRYASLLGDIGADVLHVHGLSFAEDAFAVAQCLPQLPIVFQDHADRPPPWWRRPQWQRWYTAASGVAFTTHELARPFISTGLLGPQVRVFAIPESSSRFSQGSRAQAWAESGLYGDPCVLWVGHLSAGKDPLTVLDGVAMAVPRLPGIQLWCAFSSAPLLGAVQSRIERDPRLNGRVHLLGKVPHTHVEALMRAADVFVSGSLAESCGYALLEALACGVAPVVTDIPSFRALTGDGRVGRLWPCGDAAKLADALVSVSTQRPVPTEVRAHFDATLSFHAVGRRWMDAYAQMLDSQCRRAG